MNMLERAEQTARELGCSTRTALALEFAAARAWALVKRDIRAAATLQIGYAHAAGDIDGDTFRKLMDSR